MLGDPLRPIEEDLIWPWRQYRLSRSGAHPGLAAPDLASGLSSWSPHPKEAPMSIDQSHPKAVTALRDLILDALNANRGTARGRTLLRQSLEELGPARSIVIDAGGRVIAGNKVVEAARDLALPIQVVETDGDGLVVVQRRDLDLTDPRARRLAVADNRIGELNLDWDPEVLAQLHGDGVPLDELFTVDELERLVGHGFTTGQTDENEVLDPPESSTIQAGDLFILGPHRVLCGDATNPADVARLLGDARPRLMTTDPPYGVTYDAMWRHVYDPSARTAVGAVTNDDRVDWRAAWQLFPGSVMYVWHAGLHAGKVATSITSGGFAVRAQIVWVKPHFVLSRGAYHWQHEPCWYAVRDGADAGWVGDRTQTTVWEVAHLSPFGGERAGENTTTGHSTQKPVRLLEIPLLNHTARGDAVFDPFLGSGSTLIAAEKTGRRCVGLEIEPRYVQVIVERWERFTGGVATKVGEDRRDAEA
jgi:DNA modification methylase